MLSESGLRNPWVSHHSRALCLSALLTAKHTGMYPRAGRQTSLPSGSSETWTDLKFLNLIDLYHWRWQSNSKRPCSSIASWLTRTLLESSQGPCSNSGRRLGGYSFDAVKSSFPTMGFHFCTYIHGIFASTRISFKYSVPLVSPGLALSGSRSFRLQTKNTRCPTVAGRR